MVLCAFLVFAPNQGLCQMEGIPVIIKQPENQSVPLGGTATFTVEILPNADPVTFVWQKDGRNFLSVSEPTLELSEVQVVAAGEYQVRMVTSSGWAWSTPVELRLEPAKVEILENQIFQIAENSPDGSSPSLISALPETVAQVEIINPNQVPLTYSILDQELRFSNTPLPPSEANTQSVVIGDVNKDGFVDVIAGNDGINRLYLSASGEFTGEGIEIAADAHNTHSVALGDVNRDGYLDLIAGNDGVNRLYLNDRTGSFADGINLGSEIDITKAIALNDINRDGYLDLIAGNTGVNRIYVSNRDGTFGPGINLSSDSDITHALGVGDMDRDGDLDIVTGNDGINRLYLNNGNGTFGDGISIAPDLDNTQAIALGDIDRDGDPDVVTGNNGLDRIYLNNRDGTFAAGIELNSSVENTQSTVLVDMDHDGDLDIVIASNNVNHLFLNIGDGLFSDGIQISNDSEMTHSMAVADLDRDGDLDIIAGNNGVNRVFTNHGPAFAIDGTTGELSIADSAQIDFEANSSFPLAVHVSGGLPTFTEGFRDAAPSRNVVDLVFGDLDGDGDLDLWKSNQDTRSEVWINDGTGVYTDTGQRLASGGSARVALGDVDGDGDQDAWVANLQAPNEVWLNDGQGTFSNSDQRLGNNESANVSLGDVDGDGDLDAFVANHGVNRLWLNDGSGSFTDSGQEFAESRSGDVELGDLDGDLDLDVWVANMDQANQVWLNDGNGIFSHSGQLLGRFASENVALGDVDGDGDLDAWVANHGPNHVWLNDGGGLFSDNGQPMGRRRSGNVELADFDGDGDLDAWVAQTGDFPTLWINRGNGLFGGGRNPYPLEGISSVTPVVALGDVDGDGDPDFFSSYVFNGVIGSINNGGGVWTKTTVLNKGLIEFDVIPRDLPLGDVDGDGDLDAFLLNSFGLSSWPSRVWTNDGNGGFLDSGQSLGATGLGWGVELGDVDADGDLDAFVVSFDAVNRAGQPNQVLLNDGSGNFQDSGQRFGPTESREVSLGDVDGDGDLDAFIANERRPNEVLLNDGDGNFHDNGQIFESHSSGAASLGDLDGDGDLDVYIAGADANNRVWMNDGDGNFEDTGQRLGTTLRFGIALAIGDLDADGDLDVFVGNGRDSHRVWFNNGNGVFQESGPIPNSTNGAPIHVFLGDVDGDGDLDAWAMNERSFSSGSNNNLLDSHIQVWLNDGNGEFLDSGQILKTSGFAFGIGDLDTDGDLDAWVADNGPSSFWLNDGNSGFSDTKLITINLLDVDENPPRITLDPQSQNLTGNRRTVNLTAVVDGQEPLTYQWYLDGTAFGEPGIEEVPGVTTNLTALVSLQVSEPGTYGLVASNTLGRIFAETVVNEFNATRFTGSILPGYNLIGNSFETAQLEILPTSENQTGDLTLLKWNDGWEQSTLNSGATDQVVIDRGEGFFIFNPSDSVYRLRISGESVAAPISRQLISGQFHLLGRFSEGSAFDQLGVSQTEGVIELYKFIPGFGNFPEPIDEPFYDVFRFANGVWSPREPRVPVGGAAWIRVLTPIITAAPESQTVLAGGSAVFEVEADNATGIDWKRDVFTGLSESSTLIIEDAQASDAGQYSVALTNSEGSIESVPVELKVVPPFFSVKELTPAEGSANDQFGRSVAIDGETLVVGSPGLGIVYVYERNAGGTGQWDLVAELTAEGEAFGTSVAINRDTIVVGAPAAGDIGGPGQGAVYLFERSFDRLNTWNSVGKLSAEDSAIEDAAPEGGFGTSVALTSDTLAVGAPSLSGGTFGREGAVHVFERRAAEPTGWRRIARLIVPDADPEDGFGTSVEVSGNTIVAGALNSDVGNNADQGAAYVFERSADDPDVWSLPTKLTAVDGAANDSFGTSVAVEGERVSVGAPQADSELYASQGAAYVFARTVEGPSDWRQIKKVTGSSAHTGDRFGVSVSMSDEILVVGASGIANPGAAYVFARNAGGLDQWGELMQLTAPESGPRDAFGSALDLKGNYLIVGAPATENSLQSAHLFMGVNPAANSINVPVESPIKIPFDRPIDPESLTDQSVMVYSMQTGRVIDSSVSIAGSTILVHSRDVLSSAETFQVTVLDEIRDTGGATLAKTWILQFQTEVVPPIHEAAVDDIRFSGLQELRTNGVTPADVALGDVDGDGDLDTWVANSGANQLWLNDGLGFFANSGQNMGESNSRAVVLGDLDGDGDLDAWVANDGPDHVWQNDGRGGFQKTSQGYGTSDGREVKLGDLDGDGDLDVWVANFGANAIWFNAGDGTFSQSAQVFETSLSHSVSLGDIDSDGDLDAWVANEDLDVIWLNDGQGVFSNSLESFGEGGVSASREVELGDLDGDGDLDALVRVDNQYDLWGNEDGKGTFFIRAESVIRGSSPKDLSLGDLDGDGDLDAFAALAQFTRWSSNQGDGTFITTDATSVGRAANQQSVALGDIDGDGDLDAWVANAVSDPSIGAEHNIWFNMSTGPWVEPTISFELGESTAPGAEAILGEGFFEVELPNGSLAYTRNGDFVFDGKNTFLTKEGYRVTSIPAGGDYIFPIGYSFDSQGRNYFRSRDNAGNLVLFTISPHFQLSRFLNPAGLESIGSGYFLETAASARPVLGRPGDAGFGEITSALLPLPNTFGFTIEFGVLIPWGRSHSLEKSRDLKTWVSEFMHHPGNFFGTKYMYRDIEPRESGAVYYRVRINPPSRQ